MRFTWTTLFIVLVVSTIGKEVANGEYKFEFKDLTPEAAQRLGFTGRNNAQAFCEVFGKVVEAVGKVWTGLCKLFGKRVKSEAVRLVSEKGFKYFNLDSQIQYIEGVPETAFGPLGKTLARIMDMRGEKGVKITDFLDSVSWSDSHAWSDISFLFNKKSSPGGLSSSTLFGKETKPGFYSFIYVTSNAQYEISDEIWAVEESVAYGIFKENKKQRVEYRPRAMTNEDIENLFYFFGLATYKNLAGRAGIKIDDIDKPY